jgi:broad specificity phosphatase PhoE
MSTLIFVRHGQASFLTDDYDRLSDLGHDQAYRLGKYWASLGWEFDQAYTGPGRRHRETAAGVMEAYLEAGLPFPAPEVIEDLHEYDWDALLGNGLPALAAERPEIAQLAGAYRDAESNSEKRRAFQRMFEAVSDLWVREQFHVPEVEPWHAFSQRVWGAIDHITHAAPRKSRIAAFTSGGPAAVAVQRALDMSPVKALELVWTLRNAALVEFLFSGDRFSLSAFNEAPHLPTPELWTYR